MSKYAVIVGHGRSGTNWLLDLFDLSSNTFCRNEPHELMSSPIRKLDSHRVFVKREQNILIENWDSIIHEVGNSMSYYDPWIKSKKNYFSSGKPVYIALRSNKLRKILSLIFEEYSKDEWLLPLSAVNPEQWKSAYRIFKFVQSPGWAGYLLRHKPDVHIFHIVRHPGGYLNSWKNRYLANQSKQTVFADNLNRLKMISNEDLNWAEKFGDLRQLGLLNSELWYWYYANEVIYQAGKDKLNYTLINYEELADDPLSKLKELYSNVNLILDDDIQEKVKISSAGSKLISEAWQHRLEDSEVDICQSFIDIAERSFLPKS